MRHCTTHALYRSKLWQWDQCHCHRWIVTNNRDVPRVMKTKFLATVMVFGVISSEGHIMPPLRSQLESQHQSVPGCAEECGDPLVQSGGRWQTLGVAAGLGASSLAPPPPPTWTRWTSTFGHMSRTSLTWHPTTPKPAWLPPSANIYWAPTGACGKSMLPVPDPYQGGDWGWRWLHWIDVSSTT